MTIVTKYWDKEILNWDKKYLSIKGSTLQARLHTASRLIKCLDKDIRVLDIGCGTGRLAREINNREYFGIDTSAAAIKQARKLNNNTNASFKTMNISDLTLQSFDVIVSLGLTDWIDDIDLERTTAISKGKLFIHSFSLNNTSLHCIIHKLFSKFKYKELRPNYPRKYSENDIRTFFNDDVTIIKTKQMSFGVIATNI